MILTMKSDIFLRLVFSRLFFVVFACFQRIVRVFSSRKFATLTVPLQHRNATYRSLRRARLTLCTHISGCCPMTILSCASDAYGPRQTRCRKGPCLEERDETPALFDIDSIEVS